MDRAPHPTDASALLLAEVDGVRRLARHLVRDAHDADDIAQDAMRVALERPPRSGWPVGAFLRGVVRRLVLSRRRSDATRRRREREAARPEAGAPDLDVADRMARQRLVLDCVAALPEPYAQVIVLSFFDQLPPRRIAARLGIPVETVRTRIRRGIERLREILGQRHQGSRRGWCLALAPITGDHDFLTLPRIADALSMTQPVKIAVAAAVVLSAGVGVYVICANRGPTGIDVLGRAPSSHVVAEAAPAATQPDFDAIPLGTPEPKQSAATPVEPKVIEAPASPAGIPEYVEAGGEVRRVTPIRDVDRPLSASANSEPGDRRRRLALLLQERLRLESAMAVGIEAFAAEKYVEARVAARTVLAEEPDHAKAIELDEAAARALSRESDADAVSRQRKTLEAWLLDTRLTPRLEQLLLKWPSASFWGRLTSLPPDANGRSPASDDMALRAIAERTLVTVTFESTPLSQATRALEAQSAIEILVDPALRTQVPPVIVRHLDARGMSLVAVLDVLAREGEFVWTIDGASVVLSRRPTDPDASGRSAALLTAYYDVSDLLTPTRAAADAAASPLGPTRTFASIGALVAVVEVEVDPSSWGERGASIRAVARTLVVKASESAHRHVKEWLARRRLPK